MQLQLHKGSQQTRTLLMHAAPPLAYAKLDLISYTDSHACPKSKGSDNVKSFLSIHCVIPE